MEKCLVTALSHEGRGIIKAEGKKTVFVDFALLGEEITYETYATHAKFDEAKTISVRHPSDKRITPLCPYFGVCGGCTLQHMSHDEQIRIKQNTLLEHLKHQANLVPKRILKPVIGPLWHYRHKARLSVAQNGQKRQIGFKQYRSHKIAPIEQCLVLDKSVDCRALTQLLNNLSSSLSISSLDIAVGNEGTAFILHHSPPLTDSDQRQIEKFCQIHSCQFYSQTHGRSSIAKIYPKDGQEFLTYTLQDLCFRFHPADFTQINPAINQQMVEQALDLLELTPSDHVLDLYCGIGNFSLPIAQKAGFVTGVEGVEVMVKQAQLNARLNQINNTKFFTADLSKNTTSWPLESYTKLLVDPPRTGTNMKLIIALNIPFIIYISCDTATLARDAKALAQNGYTLDAAGVMDMFPHTKHIESIAVFKAFNTGTPEKLSLKY